ncbi:MAG TPA: hypothetical protein EYP73_06810, partial [Acidimicrobiia bacterium]|nr:hypothetical protein [Acidimicrobiia bacterium]
MAKLLRGRWVLLGLLALAACAAGETEAPPPAAATTTTAPPVTIATVVTSTSTTLPPDSAAAPRLEVWMVPGHGTPPDLGPLFAVLTDGTIYIRDFRDEGSGPDPVWTGRLADPSLVESLVAEGMDAAIVNDPIARAYLEWRGQIRYLTRA